MPCGRIDEELLQAVPMLLPIALTSARSSDEQVRP